MQAISSTSSPLSSMTGDASGLQSQIAALRESLRNQRERARKMWETASPGTELQDNRTNLGRFTEKLLNGPLDEIYG